MISMDVERFQCKRRDTSFKLGGDGESFNRWMVQLPAQFGDKVDRIQCFVIFGALPMLLGRPIREMLNLWLTLVANACAFWEANGKRSVVARVVPCFRTWRKESPMVAVLH